MNKFKGLFIFTEGSNLVITCEDRNNIRSRFYGDNNNILVYEVIDPEKGMIVLDGKFQVMSVNVPLYNVKYFVE